jgi:hypothetical protein
MAIIKGSKLSLICEELKLAIENAYNEGISIPDAEKLAARTLTARLELSDEIKSAALDSKMRRNGVKVVRANAYMDEITKHDKKPAEAFLENAVNLSPEVNEEENSYAEAEAELSRLIAYLDVFKDAHLYFRTIMKGSFEG